MPRHTRESTGPFLSVETSVNDHDPSHRRLGWVTRAVGITTMTEAEGHWPPEKKHIQI